MTRTSVVAFGLAISLLTAGNAYANLPASFSVNTGATSYGPANTKQTFTFNFSGGTLGFFQGVIGTAVTVDSNCYFQMYTTSNSYSLWLIADGGGWLGPIALGSGASLSNSQCTFYAAGLGGSVTSGTVQVQFSSSYQGKKNFFALPGDAGAYGPAWLEANNTYTIDQPSAIPTVQGMTGSASGLEGQYQLFTFHYADTAGTQDILYGNMLFSPDPSALVGTGSCQIEWNYATGQLDLLGVGP